MSYITLKQVDKVLGGKKVLDGISLELERGKVYGFHGGNGSGKTMLFRAIAGLIKPTSGTIHIENKQLHKDISFPKSLGILIETPGFWKYLSGVENLKLLAHIQNKISEDQIRETIRLVGLDPENRKPVKTYSLGMRQRLGIAQALMEQPELLILDEPTNALDEDGVLLFRNLLKIEKAKKNTILIASHNREDLEILADVSFKMKDGKIIEGIKEGNLL